MHKLWIKRLPNWNERSASSCSLLFLHVFFILLPFLPSLLPTHSSLSLSLSLSLPFSPSLSLSPFPHYFLSGLCSKCRTQLSCILSISSLSEPSTLTNLISLLELVCSEIRYHTNLSEFHGVIVQKGWWSSNGLFTVFTKDAWTVFGILTLTWPTSIAGMNASWIMCTI